LLVVVLVNDYSMKLMMLVRARVIEFDDTLYLMANQQLMMNNRRL
jgi:hypothetical protein